MESSTECIADDLEDISVLGLNGLVQDLMMPREKSWHGIGILLRQLGTTFNIGEEEGDSASGKMVCHGVLIANWIACSIVMARPSPHFFFRSSSPNISRKVLTSFSYSTSSLFVLGVSITLRISCAVP